MKRTVIVSLCVALVCMSASPKMAAGFNKVGKAVMQFTKIGIGARQVAMGDAGSAVVRGVHSAFSNPGGLRGIDGPGEASAPPKSAKSRLQEWTQRYRHTKPFYALLATVGPPHDQTFTVAAVVDGRELATGEGSSRQRAEERAAALALANRVYILSNGHMAHEGPAAEIKAQPDLLQRSLGV